MADSSQVDHSSAINQIARLGFFTKGLIYGSVGVLAFQIAIGMGGQTSDATSLLKDFIYKPFGTVLLIFCTVGLLAHAVWKGINAIWDVESNGTDASGLFFRGIEIIVGLLYLSFSYATLQILLGKGAQSSTQTTQVWIAEVLGWPFGKWIVFGVALIACIVGGYQFYTIYTDNFDDQFNYSKMDNSERRLVRGLGRIGIVAWGIVYFMMAFLFFQAAMHANAKEAGGLGRALSALAAEPYGAWVLGITSLGLMIYGLYLFVQTYYYEAQE